jgi:dethiobiotin synthetase
LQRRNSLGSSIFITATDTGVGKTFISAGLCEIARDLGFSVGYLKPISSGGTDDIKYVKGKAGLVDDVDIVNPIRYMLPLSPYAAGKTEKVKMDLTKIKRTLKSMEKYREFVVVEGIGGVYVPIKKGSFVSDMIKKLELPAVLVARAGLGTINHTLLSVKELRLKKIRIKGIILNGFTGKELSERSNAQVIEELSGVPVIGHIKANSSFHSLVKQLKHQKVLEKLI